MYLTIGKNQFHIGQCIEMGKDAFIAAHRGSVRDVAKAWAEIEKHKPVAEKKKAVKTEE